MADEPEDINEVAAAAPGADAGAAENGEDTNSWGDDADGQSERILNQDEIDSLLGFDLSEEEGGERTGIRAIINSALV
ncbi:MAG: flagellar motor switch protein FliM, partial [Phenylobacterium sp.]